MAVATPLNHVPIYFRSGLLHAGGIVYQGAVLGLHRAAGFAPQANVAAGALVLAMTYFLAHPRWHWLAAPLAAAIPFTGARWATGVGIAVLVGMLVTRRARPSGVAAVVVAVALVVLPLHDIVIHNYTRGGVVEDAARRLPGTPSIAPRGFSEGTYKGETVGSHSVPLRMAQETGILSAVAWIVVTAYVLWRRPRLTVDWWAPGRHRRPVTALLLDLGRTPGGVLVVAGPEVSTGPVVPGEA